MVLLYNDSSATPAHLLMAGAIVVVLYGLSSVTNSILHGLNYMTSPAKNAAAALGIHLVAFVLMMTVFKMNVYALVGGNIVFALAVKALVLLLGALGMANMWEAVFADVGVSVIAILNSMRTLNTK